MTNEENNEIKEEKAEEQLVNNQVEEPTKFEATDDNMNAPKKSNTLVIVLIIFLVLSIGFGIYA